MLTKPDGHVARVPTVERDDQGVQIRPRHRPQLDGRPAPADRERHGAGGCHGRLGAARRSSNGNGLGGRRFGHRVAVGVEELKNDGDAGGRATGVDKLGGGGDGGRGGLHAEGRGSGGSDVGRGDLANGVDPVGLDVDGRGAVEEGLAVDAAT